MVRVNKLCIDKLSEYSHVYIYGAGDVAREVAYCLTSPIYNIRIAGFLVTEIHENSDKTIMGSPVLKYTTISGQDDFVIIIAVLEKYKDAIIKNLCDIGINDYIVLTFESDEWCEVRGKYFHDKAMRNHSYEYKWLEELATNEKELKSKLGLLKVYIARSEVDKELVEIFRNRDWEEDIQVGTALTNRKICEVHDDTGENISQKNKQYCELTALYWIWKNSNYDWVGLSHYRRRFLLSDMEIDRLIDSSVDAVFTTPLINEPDVKFMYEKNHSANDWQIMRNAVNSLFPEYNEAFKKVEMSECYIPYNMFIARRTFLDDYCNWLFPILEYCEKRIGIKEDTYQNRYVGFLAERLMSVYFTHNIDKYKMVFAHKHFIETKVD